MPGIRDLKGKVVLVTGAGSGIGRASAVAFANEGATVIVGDIDESRAIETAQEIARNGGNAEPVQHDAANREATEALAANLIEAHGGVDVLYNNAGIGVGGPTLDATAEEWERLININLWGVIHGMRAFVPHMIERRSGHIVNTASTAGFFPCPGLAGYSATKHAVLGLGQAWRAELRYKNVGVSTICPGIIKTNLVRDGVMYETPKFTEDRFGSLMDRVGRPPEKVARAVIKAVKRNRAIVPVGIEAWFGWYLIRLSPGLAALLLQRPMASQMRQ